MKILRYANLVKHLNQPNQQELSTSAFISSSINDVLKDTPL